MWDVRFSGGVGGIEGGVGGIEEETANSRKPSSDQKPPKPFDSWFPAISIGIDLGTVVPLELQTSVGEFAVPQKFSRRSMVMQFADDENSTLERWFENWINGIIFPKTSNSFPYNGAVVSTLAESWRRVEVARLSSGAEERSRAIAFSEVGANVTSYLVFPEGKLEFSGTSESGLRIYTLQFAIARIEKNQV